MKKILISSIISQVLSNKTIIRTLKILFHRHFKGYPVDSTVYSEPKLITCELHRYDLAQSIGKQ